MGRRGKKKPEPGVCETCKKEVKNLGLHRYLVHQTKYRVLVCPRCDYADLPIDRNLFRRHLQKHPHLPQDDYVQRYGQEVSRGFISLARCSCCDYKTVHQPLLAEHTAKHQPLDFVAPASLTPSATVTMNATNTKSVTPSAATPAEVIPVPDSPQPVSAAMGAPTAQGSFPPSIQAPNADSVTPSAPMLAKVASVLDSAQPVSAATEAPTAPRSLPPPTPAPTSASTTPLATAIIKDVPVPDPPQTVLAQDTPQTDSATGVASTVQGFLPTCTQPPTNTSCVVTSAANAVSTASASAVQTASADQPQITTHDDMVIGDESFQPLSPVSSTIDLPTQPTAFSTFTQEEAEIVSVMALSDYLTREDSPMDVDLDPLSTVLDLALNEVPMDIGQTPAKTQIKTKTKTKTKTKIKPASKCQGKRPVKKNLKKVKKPKDTGTTLDLSKIPILDENHPLWKDAIPLKEVAEQAWLQKCTPIAPKPAATTPEPPLAVLPEPIAVPSLSRVCATSTLNRDKKGIGFPGKAKDPEALQNC